jgi:hypothetical protein
MDVDKLDKLDQKLEKIEERLTSIDVTLGKQATQLEHHIYRTDLAEKHLSILEADLQPLKKHVVMVGGAMKLIGLIATIVALASGVVRVLEFFNR